MTKLPFVVIALCTNLLLSNILFSEMVVSHFGSADPLSQQWTSWSLSGQNGVQAGATSDNGTDAWFVDDNSTQLGSFGGYEYGVDSSTTSVANNIGWVLSTNLRIASDESILFEGSPFVGYRDGNKGWQMNFGLNANGDTIVRLFTGGLTNGPLFTIQGNSSYNTFALHYNSEANNADLLINGVEVFSGYTGFNTTESRVLWGAASSADSGQGNFNAVSLVVIPEPTSFALFGLFLFAGTFRRKSQA